MKKEKVMNNKFKELYEKIRIDLISQISENNISLDDIANDLGITSNELYEYLSLYKTDYLVYKKIDGIVKKKVKKGN